MPAAERSIAARVREADAAGFAGTAKELAAALDVDVRRIYSARAQIRKLPNAGKRGAQPAKRLRTFVGAMPAELRLERVRARTVACPTCAAPHGNGCADVPDEAFEWGVHVARARLAGCPRLPSVAELNAGVRP